MNNNLNNNDNLNLNDNVDEVKANLEENIEKKIDENITQTDANENIKNDVHQNGSSNYIENKLIETEKKLTEFELKANENKELATAIEEQLISCNNDLKQNQEELKKLQKELREEKAKPKKKPFRFFRWLFASLFKLLILAILVVFVYFNISQIQNDVYSNLNDDQFSSIVLNSANKSDKVLISVEDINAHLDNIRKANPIDLPLDLKVSDLFYQGETGAFVANIDGKWASTSLILYGQFKDGKFEIENSNLGKYNISVDWIRERINLPIDNVVSMINSALDISPSLKISDVGLYSDGVLLNTTYDSKLTSSLMNTLKSNVDQELIDSGVLSDFEDAKNIYNSVIKPSEVSLATIENVISDEVKLATLLSLMTPEKSKESIELIERATESKLDLKGLDRAFNQNYMIKLSARQECQDIAIKLEEALKAIEAKDAALAEKEKQLEIAANEKLELSEKIKVFTSTVLAKWEEQGSATKLDDEHGIDKINDGVIESAWATKENKGLGEIIYFKSSSAQSISKMSIINGLSTDYMNNNRISKLLLEYSNGNSAILELDPNNQAIQYFDINQENINWVRITILGVTNGDGADAATYISELQFELMKNL